MPSAWPTTSPIISQEAEKVRAAGGLFIIGTERHDSRRIDNQLRGRAGRQGDPGESRFYISLEDDLLRLFGGERIQNMMEKISTWMRTLLIESKMLTKAIENAQTTVESRNFQSRKSVLEYDDVMNKQREIIYGQRRQVLDGKDIQETILNMMHTTIGNEVGLAFGEKTHLDEAGYRELLRGSGGPVLPQGRRRHPGRRASPQQRRADGALLRGRRKDLRGQGGRRSPPPSCGSWSGSSCSGWWMSTGWTTSTPWMT